jgi:hypothetical protein
MIRWRDQHQRVVGEVLTHQIHVLGRLTHDVEVVLVVGQALQQHLAVAHQHRHLDTRVGCAEAAQQLGHGVLHRGQDGQLETAALHALQRSEVLRQTLHADLDVLAGVAQCLARSGQKYLLAHLLEQGLPHGLGQLLDLQRQRGGRQMQLLGCAGEAALAGHGEKDAQLVQGGVAWVHVGLE